ncbi:Gfo/Idh/MocA family oxidoreductase [Segetibacter sp.]|jgi:UDP-N-acetyl-2-amino-2-deoxyglucuronate dehydrogenase|uniref:Gfo/Idh/MocA family protein n=1 Tax=Segetibacter sp. TaxID=2231182 RepID=UPI00261A88F9|nr:Gfo/Idh/MocA family oxidoreductase [Segetibacter sp.]MCW3081755.1 Myo-inositol 2-dehydrogenase [Segetibacter sp.]
MKKYNVGIIGYGWVAGAHIGAINASTDAQVTAVFSSRPLNSAALSTKWGSEIKAYTELEQLLNDPSINVVSICSYPYQHKDHAIAAAKAGKHLIIEKPLALSAEDCKAIEQAVKEAGVKTCICFECRFSSQFITTKSVIDQGLLGDLHYGEIDYYHGIGPWYSPFRWNIKKDAGGSALLTAGCHALDALLLCMGNDVEEVTSYETKSRSSFFEPYEYATSSVTILKFGSGRIGKCAAVVDCLQPYYFHTHLCGSEGSLLDNKFHSMKLGTNRHEWSTLAMKMLDSGDVSDHPYQTQFQTFFDSINAGVEMPLTSIADAMKTHKIIFAADQSAATGKAVRV